MSEAIQTKDIKEATLHAILRRLEDIDHDAATRGTFAASIVMQQMHQMDKPAFEAEIELIQHALGIESKKDVEIKEAGTVEVDKRPKQFQLDEL